MKQKLTRPMWIAITGVSLLLLILMVANPSTLWSILSVPFVLFLPGFALTVILFPGKNLDLLERFLLSIGLSVAFTALSGLILASTPWGLQAKTLWIAFILFMLVAVTVIFFTHRSRLTDVISFPTGLNFNARQWVLMGLAAFMAIMAINIARMPTSQQGFEGYTLLSIKAADTPGTIHVGVESEEFKTIYYQIKYESNGTIREGPTFKLQPGETWDRIVPVPTNKLAGTSFTVLLFRLDNPEDVYRRVIWWPDSQTK